MRRGDIVEALKWVLIAQSNDCPASVGLEKQVTLSATEAQQAEAEAWIATFRPNIHLHDGIYVCPNAASFTNV